MKQAKKKIAKKTAKPKKPKAARQEDHPELFPVASPVTATRSLPTSPRIRETDPKIYATLLVAALLHEAQAPLPWHRLRNAYILATAPKLMLSHALPDDNKRVEEWKKSWNQLSRPGTSSGSDQEPGGKKPRGGKDHFRRTGFRSDGRKRS